MRLREVFARMPALIAVGSLVLAACQPAAPSAPTGGSAAPTGPQPAEKQELKVGIPRVLANLDPHTTAGAYQGTKFALFDTVTWVDPQGKLVPWIATSWRSVESTVWEFKIRDGVKFSNGEKLDAAAIKWNIERIIKPENKLALAGRIPLVTSADAVDATTLRVTTKGTDAILPARMSAIFVVPPAEMQKLGDKDFAVKPVGSGPFKVSSFTPESALVLDRFAESWRQTKVEKLTFQQLLEPSSRLAAIRTGEFQIIQDIPADQISVLEREGVTIASTTFARLHVLDFDQVTEDTPLKNPKVRLALNYAIDKDAILKKLHGGRGKLADGQLMGSAGFGYDSSLKPIPYDVAQAKRLLAEAGYPNGFTIRMEVQSDSREEGVVLQSFFRDAGVNAELEVYENAVWLDHFYGRSKRAPIFHWRPNYFPAMDADFTLQWYICASGKKVYCNAEFDKLYTASTVEPDPTKRLEIIKQMHKVIRDDLPVAFLIEPAIVWAHSKNVTGFTPRSDGEGTFEQVVLTK